MLFASWILIKLDMNGEEGSGTNPFQWRHHWLHGWLITDKELSMLKFTCIFYFIYMQVYVRSMQNTAEGLRRPERLWFR